MVTIGGQLSPRWALQLNYAYAHQRMREDPAYTGTTLTGQQIYGWRSFEEWAHSFSSIVRYRLFHAPGSRSQLEAFGGGTWVSSRFENLEEEFLDGQLKSRISSVGDTRQVYATAGLGVSFNFSRRFQGVFDYGYVRNLKSAPEAVHLELTGNRWGLTRCVGLGLRYRFNLPHHKSATETPAP